MYIIDDYFDLSFDDDLEVEITEDKYEQMYSNTEQVSGQDFYVDNDDDYADDWFSDEQYTYHDSKKILDNMNISHIEKYLRDKKLEIINKK